MPSVTQAASAVGSLLLVTVVMMVWWWSEVDKKSAAQQEVYLKSADDVTKFERHVKDAKERTAELERELEELEDKEKSIHKGLSGDHKKLAETADAVDALGDRVQATPHALAWLSFILMPLSADRGENERAALAKELEEDRIAVSKLTMTDDIVVLEGASLFPEDTPYFVQRLAASGYLDGVKLNTQTTDIDTAHNKSFATWKISAEILAPPRMPDLGLGINLEDLPDPDEGMDD